MNFDEYVLKFSDKEDEILAQLNRETHVKILAPRMLSGHFQGKLLEFISKMINPQRILELGTYTGYSAICLAKGLSESGRLDTVEINDELESIALKYFEAYGFREKIRLYHGDAVQIIPQLNEIYDLVFIDADKRHYTEYYNLVFDKVRSGGFIIADNVLWDGKVLQNPVPTDDYTQGIARFNEMIRTDSRVEKILLPVRDGLMLIRKK